MPQVAYYRSTQLTAEDSTNLLKRMHKECGKDLGYEDPATLRLKDGIVEVKTTGILVFERVKATVKDVEEVRNIEKTNGFIRFSMGAFPSVYHLIDSRKKEGRNDWY